MAARRILSLIAAKLPPNPLRAEVSRNSFPRSHQCYTRGFQTIPESTTDLVGINQVQHGSDCSNLNPATTKPIPVSETNQTSSSSTKHLVNSNLKVSERHDLAMIFTCKVCDVRSIKTVCRESYEKGVVVARCDGCNNMHLIADRLGWFGEPSSVEEFLAARGEEVKKGSVDTFNLTLEDLAVMGIMKACSGAVGSKGSIFTSKWIRMGSLNPCESSQRKCSLVKPNPPSLASSAPIFKRVSGNSFLGSYQCYTRGFQTIPESIPVSETNQTSSSSKEHSLDSNLKVSERRDLPMIFTCKVCEVRSTKAVCRESYEKGVVVARCDGCNNFHLIADRLGLLGESSVEEFLAARGEDVRKGSFETFNLTLKDLAGAGSSLSDYALSEADPIVRYIIDDEKNSQCTRLELTASENYTSRAVMEAVGSCLTNNCSIGSSGKSYSIKSLESVCHDWALEAFHLKEKKWGVNFQTLSGSSPNFEVYEAILSPRDRIMGLDLPHGFISDERRVSGTPTCFESMPYRLDESTGLIDYDMLEKTATSFRPKLIIAGASAHPRDVDYPRMRKIADAVGAFLMMDMAHISGLVSASVVANPFDFCDIVTTTTHKSLRGPRGGMIFFKKGTVLGVNLESAINNAVLPGLQGGPHFPTIGGIAVSLNHAKTPEFKAYQNKMVSNSRALAGRLVELGYELVTGGTDNHLVLVDLRPLGIDGARVERILGNASITLSKNFVPGDDDKSAVVPGGILIGSSAMTIRGFKEHDFIQVADFIHEGVQITLKANASATGSELKDFMKFNIYSEIPLRDRVRDLCGRVRELITPFPIPGL